MTDALNLTSLFERAESLDYGDIHIKFDPVTKLRAIVAIHSTRLGPALGGCRCLEYDTAEDALLDAIRLANSMSKKAAIADLPLGGGKCVIMKPKVIEDREAYFREYGRFVNSLGGRYITAVDSGSSLEDMDIVNQETPFVAGTSKDDGAPSPYTADGCLKGLEAAVKFKLGRNSFEGLHVAMQGVGKVGYALAKHLHEGGARLTITDSCGENIDRAVTDFNATAVEPNQIHSVECDIFSPCALGSSINKNTIGQLRTSIIAGCANNQLETTELGDELRKRDILYAPDFAINAGGLIFASGVYLKVEHERIDAKINNLYNVLMNIFERADKENLATNKVANIIALEKIARGPQ